MKKKPEDASWADGWRQGFIAAFRLKCGQRDLYEEMRDEYLQRKQPDK